MLLSELLQDVRVRCKFTDVEIKDVTDDSQRVDEGFVFVCIKGKISDGHDYAHQISKKGVVCVVERDMGIENQIIVDDTRKAYSLICANYFSNPAKKLKLIGITGTNGKTTTTYLLKEILERAGKKVGLIGTIEDVVGNSSFQAKRTTPDSYFLQKLFYKMLENGCEYCVMEVSSQALAQSRVYGCSFEYAVFTNLTQDHLDYHGTMDNYIKAKKILFFNTKNAVVNIGDEYAGCILNDIKCSVHTFSAVSQADYFATNVAISDKFSSFILKHKKGSDYVNLAIPGKFSVVNALGAIAVADCLGIDMDSIIESLKETHGVRGRMEYISINTDYTVIIDYAHTPDGLENVLNVLNALKKGKLITLFGCGGDRDRGKRRLMGEVAAKLSDYSVVTSDNPRGEDPLQIIKDITVAYENVSAEKFTAIVDRREAIAYALSIAKKNDIVLLAGKGHECYQILAGSVIHFDEREIVREIIEKENNTNQ